MGVELGLGLRWGRKLEGGGKYPDAGECDHSMKESWLIDFLFVRGAKIGFPFPGQCTYT